MLDDDLDALLHLGSRHPSIDIFLEAGHSSQLMAELEDGSLDVVFLVLRPGTEKKFAVEGLWKFEVSLVTSPRLAPRRRVSLKSLAQHPFLLYRQESYFEEQIDQYFQRHGFVPNVAMRLDNAEPMKALVRSGFGISPIPHWAVRKEIESGELVEIRLKESPPVSQLAMIRRRTRHVPAPAAAFIQLAEEWMELAQL